MREFKGILIGDTGVGKDSILNRLIEDDFRPTVSTIGVAFRVRYYPNAKLSFWNIGGQKRYREVVKLYFKNTNVCIIVYDVSSQESFESCKFWLNYFKQSGPSDVQIYILGNKADLLSARQLHEHQKLLTEYATSEHITPGIVSAKTALNIEDFFDTVMSNLLITPIVPEKIEILHPPPPPTKCNCIIV